jgi:hypothetical protein
VRRTVPGVPDICSRISVFVRLFFRARADFLRGNVAPDYLASIESLSMAQTAEFMSTIASDGGYARAQALSPKKRERIAKKAANARWAGLTAEERKIERAKGRDGSHKKAAN